MNPTYTALLTLGDAGYTATCPELGVAADGPTQQASVDALNAAIRPLVEQTNPEFAAKRPYLITNIAVPEHCSEH